MVAAVQLRCLVLISTYATSPYIFGGSLATAISLFADCTAEGEGRDSTSSIAVRKHSAFLEHVHHLGSRCADGNEQALSITGVKPCNLVKASGIIHVYLVLKFCAPVWFFFLIGFPCTLCAGWRQPVLARGGRWHTLPRSTARVAGYGRGQYLPGHRFYPVWLRETSL